jgi:hypothetical protein
MFLAHFMGFYAKIGKELAVFGAFLSFISSAVGWWKNQGLRVRVDFF